MFKFLKDKLKGAVEKFSKNVDEKEVIEEELVEEEPESPAQPEEEPAEESQEELVEPEQAEPAKAPKPKKKQSEKKKNVPKEVVEELPEPEVDTSELQAALAEIDEPKEKSVEEKEEPAPSIEEELPVAEPGRFELEEEEEEIEAVEEPQEEAAEEETVEEVSEPEVEVVEIAQPEKKKGFGFFKKKEKKETIVEEQTDPDRQEKSGILTKLSHKLTTIQISEEKFEELFWDLELGLLENNVALSVIEKIKADLKEELTTGRKARGNLQERILFRLEQSLRDVLSAETIPLKEMTQAHKPLVIAAVGINGTGKTTTLAKLVKYFQNQDLSVVLAAADTFRAAAIQQLEAHAKALNAPIVKQDYGADPAAVAFDAIRHAEAKEHDVVLIDTAGRLHSNTNLMDELAKVMRVAKPHLVFFIGESTTGNDCVEQAEEFSKITQIDAIILTKADVDDKGGAAISVTHVTGKPIIFLGTGQGYDDLEEFNPDRIIKQVLPQ